MLISNSLFIPNCPSTHGDPPASAFPVLGLQVYASMPCLGWSFKRPSALLQVSRTLAPSQACWLSSGGLLWRYSMEMSTLTEVPSCLAGSANPLYKVPAAVRVSWHCQTSLSGPCAVPQSPWVLALGSWTQTAHGRYNGKMWTSVGKVHVYGNVGGKVPPN